MSSPRFCPKCQGVGLVPVPRVTLEDSGELVHHKWPRLRVIDGKDEWVIDETSAPQMTLVVCNCSHGVKHIGIMIKGPDGREWPRMDLEFYEMRLNPNWKAELEDFERSKRDRFWSENKHKSPWKDLTVSDEHTKEGENEVAYTIGTAAGIASSRLIQAARFHPAYVYLGALSIAMVKDIVAVIKGNGKKGRAA